MISIQSLAKNTAKAALLFLLHFDLPFVKGQSIDERYDVYLNPFSPSNNSPDPQTYDYCLTQKAHGKGYVAVSGSLNNKTWIFTNDNQVCGYVPLDFNILQQSADTPFSVINQSKSLPPVLELALDYFLLEPESADCDQKPN
jgi:hypothetical protein